MDIKNLDKKNDLRNLDEKLELALNKFSEDAHDITDEIISEKRPVNGYELDNICRNMFYMLSDFRKDIIDYLNKYR
ncbi:hypothetical protein [Clostridium tyrobutyricum]|uniref:hypothetical protein n=1 Tax=Clostridium tyrobutyricum TaxID=1519 RepID=UPI0011C81E68|nr:hypothetical protein [Clostridium tyrobutyricum]